MVSMVMAEQHHRTPTFEARCCAAHRPPPSPLVSSLEALLDIEGVGPIHDRDQDLYEEWFRRERHEERYAHAWSYITQACRVLGVGPRGREWPAAPTSPGACGYRYTDGRNLHSIGVHSGHFVIVCPMGLDVASSVAPLAARLHERSGRPVLLKHVAPRDAASLLVYKGFAPMASYPWHCLSPLDDASFTEVVVDLSALVGEALSRPENSKVRLRLNRFRNGDGRDADLALEPAFPERRAAWGPEVRRMLARWAKGDPGRIDAYENMIEHPSRRAFRYLLRLRGEVRGFYVLERIGERAAACHANVCDHEGSPGLSEAALVQVLGHLFEHEGMVRVNLGGSETAALHRNKLKFGRVGPDQPAFLVYDDHGARPAAFTREEPS